MRRRAVHDAIRHGWPLAWCEDGGVWTATGGGFTLAIDYHMNTWCAEARDGRTLVLLHEPRPGLAARALRWEVWRIRQRRQCVCERSLTCEMRTRLAGWPGGSEG